MLTATLYTHLTKEVILMPNKKRDYKQERKTAIARKETGVGSKSGDATRHRARRKAEKTGKVKKGQDLDHKKPLSKGGSNSPSNTKASSVSENRRKGGKIGNKRKKAIGGAKGGRAKKRRSK